MKTINTIPAALSFITKKRASKTAMVLNNGNKISFNDMMWDVSLTSRLLKDNGISKNSKVAIFMDNTPQCVESFLAVTKIGAVAILINYDFTEAQIKEILDSEKPEAIFVSDYKLNLVLGAENATVFGIDDNRIFKQVSHQVKNELYTVDACDNAVVMFNTSEHGLLVKQSMTQEAFVKMTADVKKKPVNAVTSIIDGVKAFIAPLFNGFSVNTSI